MALKHGIAALAAAFSMTAMNAEKSASYFVPETNSMEESATAPVEGSAQPANPAENEPPSAFGCEETQTFTYYGSTFHACKDDVNQQLLNTFSLIGKIKQYEQEVLGLEATPNYTEYRPSQPAQIHLLSVVPLSGLTTDIEVVNITQEGEYRNEITKPTRLSSGVDNLLDEEQHYSQAGHEVFRRSTSNFGVGCNLSSELLQRGTVSLITVVLEEDFHYNVRKVWNKLPHRDIEESTANMASHAAAIGFIGSYFGENTEIYKEAERQLAKYMEFSLFAIETYNELEQITLGSHSDEQKHALIGALFEKAKKSWSGLSSVGALFDCLPFRRLFPLAYEVYQHQDNVGAFVGLMKEMPDSEYPAIGYLEQHCGGCSYSPLTRHVIR